MVDISGDLQEILNVNN